MLNTNNATSLEANAGVILNNIPGVEPKRIENESEPERPRSAVGIDYSTGRNRSFYYAKIEKLEPTQLQNEVKQVFIAAHVGGDKNSSWKIDAVEHECKRRNRNDIHDAGYEEAANTDLSERM